MQYRGTAKYIFDELSRFGLGFKELRRYDKFIVDEQHHWFFKALIKKALKKAGGHYLNSPITKGYIMTALKNNFDVNKYHEHHISSVLRKMGL